MRKVTSQDKAAVIYIGTAYPDGCDTSQYTNVTLHDKSGCEKILVLQQDASPLHGAEGDRNVIKDYAELKRITLVQERETDDGQIEHYQGGTTKTWVPAMTRHD